MVFPSVPSRLLAAALGAGLALGLAPIVVGAPATAAPAPPDERAEPTEQAEYDAPLLISIDAMTPGALPERGPITISGTVTNRDLVTWSGVNLYPFVSDEPMTTRAELSAAGGTPPEEGVGNRITDVSDRVESLAPGESSAYTIEVSRSLLGADAPGVYWFGVHASGESETTPRDEFADGRARTFLPSVPTDLEGVGDAAEAADRVQAAVVVPLRRRIGHTGSGAIAHPEAWDRALSSDGTLGRALSFGQAAAGRPVTWLVDPALPDAVRKLANGNPQRSIQPTDRRDGDGEEPTDEPTDNGGATGEATDDLVLDPMVLTAQDWLDDAQELLTSHQVLSLPYGDLDVAAAGEHAPELYALARQRRAAVLEDWRIDPAPVVSSPSGYLDATGFDAVSDDAVILVTDRMFPDDDYPEGAPGVGTYGGNTVGVTCRGASTGGPGPDAKIAPVAMRQRLLGEAAVRLLTAGEDGADPVLAVMPPQMPSEGAAEFWSGLDQPWLDLTTLTDAVGTGQDETGPDETGQNETGPDETGPDEIDPAILSYPQEQALLELHVGVLSEVQQLIEAGITLQNLLTRNDRVGGDITDEALTGASYSVRSSPTIASRTLSRSRHWVERRFTGVQISAPRGVTLSSSSGSVPVAITNRLEQPVTVRISAETDSGLTVDVGDPIPLSPESRSTIVLDARTESVGVHKLTLSLTDAEGTPLGSTERLSIRSGQVGDVIWVIIGVGVGVLFLAIVIRLVRRIRHRNDPPPADETEGETRGETEDATP